MPYITFKSFVPFWKGGVSGYSDVENCPEFGCLISRKSRNLCIYLWYWKISLKIYIMKPNHNFTCPLSRTSLILLYFNINILSKSLISFNSVRFLPDIHNEKKILPLHSIFSFSTHCHVFWADLVFFECRHIEIIVSPPYCDYCILHISVKVHFRITSIIHIELRICRNFLIFWNELV